jgi:hypothetical protein
MVNLNDIKLILHKINKYKIKSQENSNIPNNLNIYGQKLNYYVKQLGGASYGDVTDKDIDISIEFYIEECKEVDDENKKNNIPTTQIVLDTREKVLQVLNGVKNIKDQERKNKYYKEHVKCGTEYEFVDKKKYLDCENELNEIIQNINNQSDNIKNNITDKVIFPDITDKEIDGLIAWQDEFPSMPAEAKKRNIQLFQGLKAITDHKDRNKYYKEHNDCLNNNLDKEFRPIQEKYDVCENNLITVIQEYLKTRQGK